MQQTGQNMNQADLHPLLCLYLPQTNALVPSSFSFQGPRCYQWCAGANLTMPRMQDRIDDAELLRRWKG